MNTENKTDIKIESEKFLKNAREIALDIFKKVDDYNLSPYEVQMVFNIISTEIVPGQLSLYNKSLIRPPFKYITPETSE